jgi:hypothetical protein
VPGGWSAEERRRTAESARSRLVSRAGRMAGESETVQKVEANMQKPSASG